MGKTPDDISATDRQTFREAVGDVRPLKHNNINPHVKRPAPIPKQRIQDEQAVIQDLLSDPVDLAELETGEELLFKRPGVQDSVFKKLRRGQFSIEAQLDLHRMTSIEARQAIVMFINQCQAQGVRCVRIIHGKGLGSLNKEPVLKGKVNHWLKQKDEVLAFCSARPNDGGSGAVYVLLRKIK